MSKASFHCLAVVLLTALGAARASAQTPATRPADTRPAGVEHGPQFGPPDPAKHALQMAKWFADLANADGKVRDAAKVSLMGLGRGDLPALRKLVQQRRPLLPSQAVVLKDIVTQIYLSGDTFPTVENAGKGFLGIRPAEVSVGSRQPDDQPVEQPAQQIIPNAPFPGGMEMTDPNQVCGILVMERMPGFAGARVLQDGDVILGIVERPKSHFRNTEDFSAAIREIGAGEKAHFEVLRQGQVIRVETVLGPRPDNSAPPPIGILVNPLQPLLDRRAKEAENLWQAEFAPLLDEGLG